MTKLARRMARVQASAIREILKVTERPEVLSFAGGLPAPEAFPAEALARAHAEVLAHDLNHRSRPCLEGNVACQVFHQAKPALKVYTLRKRKETLDRINELARMLIRAWEVHTPRQAETARRLAVETWLQSNQVITITQNQKVLPIFLEKFAHN